MSTLKTAWSEGATTLGSWTALNTPVVAERLALVGHDYVCLDQQHGIVCDASLVASLIAVAAGGAAPLVRVAANEPSLISKALDSGAEGVIVPLVDDAQDAERAVRACRYPPRGDRSIGPIRSAGSGRTRTFAEGACIVMAESVSAVDNIDDICSVPGVNAVYVGPADLAASLGVPPALGVVPGEHADAITKILDACARHDMVAGIHCGTTQQVVECAGMGFRMITISTDTQLLSTAAAERFGEVRSAMASNS
jgi:4-hydroxy-2-oxoheptanedioate aldolase